MTEATGHRGWTVGLRCLILMAMTTGLLALVACAPERVDDPPGAPPVEAPPDPSPTPPAPPAETPGIEALLPPLPGYATDDDAEPGELRESLDHGSVQYREVGRRLVLDEDGFAVAEVTVVTLDGAEAADRLLDHRFGDAGQRRVEIGGERMLRIETEPVETLAWVRPRFVMTFQRGQERSEEWLQDLARATVGEIRSQ